MNETMQEWLTMFAVVGVVASAAVLSWGLASIWVWMFPRPSE